MRYDHVDGTGAKVSTDQDDSKRQSSTKTGANTLENVLKQNLNSSSTCDKTKMMGLAQTLTPICQEAEGKIHSGDLVHMSGPQESTDGIKLATIMGGLKITEISVVEDCDKNQTSVKSISDSFRMSCGGGLNQSISRLCHQNPHSESEVDTSSDDDDKDSGSSQNYTYRKERGPTGGRLPKTKYHPYGGDSAKPTSPSSSSESSYLSSSPGLSPQPYLPRDASSQALQMLRRSQIIMSGGGCVVSPSSCRAQALSFDRSGKSPPSRESFQSSHLAGGSLIISDVCSPPAVTNAPVLPHFTLHSSFALPTYKTVDRSVREDATVSNEGQHQVMTIPQSDLGLFQLAREMPDCSATSSAWSMSSPVTTDDSCILSPQEFPLSPFNRATPDTAISEMSASFPQCFIGSPVSVNLSVSPTDDLAGIPISSSLPYMVTAEQHGQQDPTGPSYEPLPSNLLPYLKVDGKSVLHGAFVDINCETDRDHLLAGPDMGNLFQPSQETFSPQPQQTLPMPLQLLPQSVPEVSQYSQPVVPVVSQPPSLSGQDLTFIFVAMPKNVDPPKPSPPKYKPILPKIANYSTTPLASGAPLPAAESQSQRTCLQTLPPMSSQTVSAKNRLLASLNEDLLKEACQIVDMMSAEELQESDVKDSDGDTKLHISTANGNNEWTYAIVERFIKEKLSVNKANKVGQTPLFNAVANNNPLVVAYLLQNGANANCACNDNNTPLHIVANNGFLEVARILCQVSNICLDVTNSKGFTPLHGAVKVHRNKVDNRPMIEFLLRSGAKLDIADRCSGKTALYMAVEQGNIELVGNICRLCTNIKSTINFSTFTKDNALHAASRLNHILEERQYGILKMLLHFGADASLTNNDHKYPKDLVDKRRMRAKKLLQLPKH